MIGFTKRLSKNLFLRMKMSQNGRFGAGFLCPVRINKNFREFIGLPENEDIVTISFMTRYFAVYTQLFCKKEGAKIFLDDGLFNLFQETMKDKNISKENFKFHDLTVVCNFNVIRLEDDAKLTLQYGFQIDEKDKIAEAVAKVKTLSIEVSNLRSDSDDEEEEDWKIERYRMLSQQIEEIQKGTPFTGKLLELNDLLNEIGDFLKDKTVNEEVLDQYRKKLRN